MFRKLTTIAFVFILSLAVFAPVSAAGGQPNFEPGLYADGQVFSSKGTTELPAPNDNNMQSFDKLFAITNGAPGQLAVAEAAPGNPAFNGGRWYTHTVEWTQAGMDAHDPLPVLTSYAEIMVHYNLGHLEITPGTFEGGPPAFFQCPLLPVK